DEPLVRIGERDHRRRRARAFRILDDLGVLALHHGNARVGGAEIDADDFAHVTVSPLQQAQPAFESAGPGPRVIWIERGNASPERQGATRGYTGGGWKEPPATGLIPSFRPYMGTCCFSASLFRPVYVMPHASRDRRATGGT